ncbi:hypothetical protein [Verrucomicrobium spinosum]|uniref:hypothetical protein n=1 Tax=Verrucomicrobium spinosum TaxID=2736 RepID=UPI00017465D8|nr:hypothetical protein [Verrucomicrobium spinosum]
MQQPIASEPPDEKPKQRGAPTGNQNATKPEEEKIHGRGRVIADFGHLKTRCVKAAGKQGKKLVEWLREAAEEKLAREATEVEKTPPLNLKD